MTELTRSRIIELLKRKMAGAALVMGPMLELRKIADRLEVLDEARRSLQRGGVVAALAVGRFARILDPSFTEVAHTHLATELEAELVRAGFAAPQVYAVEGPFRLSGRGDPELTSRIEQAPSLLGASLHLLGFGRKV